MTPAAPSGVVTTGQRDDMSETWLPIPGFDGYAVSSKGRVSSLARPILMRRGRIATGFDTVHRAQTAIGFI